MHTPRFTLQTVALAASLLCATGAAQAKTWVLSSDKEGLSSYNTGISIVNSIYSTFETAAGGPTETIDGRGLLHASATDPLPADVPADVDIVVVATVQPNQTVTGVQHGVDATRFAKVMDWAKTRSDLTFVFLNDGCCRPSDTGSVAGFLNNSLGLSAADEITRVGSVAPQGNSVYLNTNSPYKDNFAALDPLAAEVYGKYVNVPAPYAVYLAPAAADTPPASMPAAADKVQAYGIVVPRAATNGSACVIAFSDTSQFALASAPAQAGELANSIMAAARDSAGACQVKTVATADLVPSITLSSPLQVGGNGTLTVKVDNHGQSDSAAGGKVVVTLPAQAQVDDTALPTGCTKPAPSEVECTLGAITAQNHKTFALPITIVGSGADSTFRSQVTGAAADTGELAPQLQNNGPIERKVTIAAPTATITGPASAQPNTATTVTGTATGLADGAQVTVTVNGTALQATVTAGNFSVSFPSGFPAGTHAVTVTGPSGWALTQNGTHSIQVDPPAPATTATINGPATATAGTGFTVTGASNASDGTVIQVTVGGHTVSATVNGGQFSANIPGLAAGNYPVTITGATLTAPHSIQVNNPAPPPSPTAAINGPATAQPNTAITVTGTTANVPNGTQVNVTVGGQTVQATVNNGQFNASFPAGLPEGTHPVTVTGPNGLTQVGAHSIQVKKPVKPVDPAPEPTATITGPATAKPNTATTVTGTTAHVANGTVIQVTVNGKTVPATVNGGQFSANFPEGFPEGTHAVTVTGATLTAAHSIQVKKPADPAPAPTATITGPATAKPNTATTVTGSTANVADGTVIQVTVNGKTVPATVNGGQFSANFPEGFPEGTHAVTVTGATLTAAHSIQVEKPAPAPTATITGPAAAVPNAPTTITGTTMHVADGTVLEVTVNGVTVKATVQGGRFNAHFPNGFPTGNYSVSVSVPGGGALTQTDSFTVLVQQPSPTPGGVTAVPMLDGLGLGALAALLGAAGLRRQRKRQR